MATVNKEVETEEVEQPVQEAKKNTGGTYHVSKKGDKWEVKKAGGVKVIKSFATQKEALEYTKTMAINQDRAIILHPSKGASKGKITVKKTKEKIVKEKAKK